MPGRLRGGRPVITQPPPGGDPATLFLSTWEPGADITDGGKWSAPNGYLQDSRSEVPIISVLPGGGVNFRWVQTGDPNFNSWAWLARKFPSPLPTDWAIEEDWIWDVGDSEETAGNNAHYIEGRWDAAEINGGEYALKFQNLTDGTVHVRYQDFGSNTSQRSCGVHAKNVPFTIQLIFDSGGGADTGRRLAQVIVGGTAAVGFVPFVLPSAITGIRRGMNGGDHVPEAFSNGASPANHSITRVEMIDLTV